MHRCMRWACAMRHYKALNDAPNGYRHDYPHRWSMECREHKLVWLVLLTKTCHQPAHFKTSDRVCQDSAKLNHHHRCCRFLPVVVVGHRRRCPSLSIVVVGHHRRDCCRRGRCHRCCGCRSLPLTTSSLPSIVVIVVDVVIDRRCGPSSYHLLCRRLSCWRPSWRGCDRHGCRYCNQCHGCRYCN